jgi:Outer membrane protein beta-barrel domain
MRTKIYARVAAVALMLMAAPFARSAVAQERPAPVVEFAAGALLFPDDGETVPEGFAGGTARFYLTPRLSVGPEVAFVKGDNHDHFMLTGNVTYDFLGPVGGRPAPVTPFVVAGAGLFRTQEGFPIGDFSHTEGAFTAGGGLRALLGERVTVGAEARLGWELHVRVNGFVGVRLGR